MKPRIDRGLLLIIAFAILQFLFSYLLVNSNSRYLPDSITAYDTMVREFAGETNLPEVWEAYRSRVLYPFLVSVPYRFTKNMEFSFTFVNVLFQLILAVSCYYIGKELKLEPLILPILILSHAQVVKYASLFLTDVPALALAALCMLLYYRWIKGENFIYLLVLLVSTILTRTPFLTIIFPIALFGFLKKKPIHEVILLLVIPLATYFIINAINGAWSGLSYIQYIDNCLKGTGACEPKMTERGPTKLFNIFNQAHYPFLFFMPIGFIFSMDWFLVAQILANFITTPAWSIYTRRLFFPSLIASGILGVQGLIKLSERFGKYKEKVLWLIITAFVILGNIAAFIPPEIANQ